MYFNCLHVVQYFILLGVVNVGIQITHIHSLSFVFRPLWRAAVFSPAAAVCAAAVSAVGSANRQKTRNISPTWTLKTWRQRSENRMQVRDFVVLDARQLVQK